MASITCILVQIIVQQSLVPAGTSIMEEAVRLWKLAAAQGFEPALSSSSYDFIILGGGVAGLDCGMQPLLGHGDILR